MSVVASLGNFSIKHCALLLGCVLAQQSAFARSDDAPIFFLATNLPAADAVATAPSARSGATEGSLEEQASFAMFVPLPDAALIRDRIAGLEEAGDYYSPGVAELAEELGKVLQAEGQHRAAIEAYDRSFQIVRRQEGLSSAAQATLLHAEIESYLALGDIETGDALQHTLFSMQQQLLAEKPVALAEAHVTVADWNLQYYLQALQAPVPGGRTEAQEKALAERLGEGVMQYHQALWLLSTAAADGFVEEKVAIERKIAALMLMVDRQYQRNAPTTLGKASHSSIQQSKNAHDPVLLNHGSAALQRAIAYSTASAEPVRIAERQLELADWYLLMDQYDEARAAYATAVESLRAAGVQETQITTVLESGLPVHDPETDLLALANDEAVGAFDGYIDVAFDLNRYGKASNARVLAGASYDEQTEEDLLRRIQDSRFRPGFDQGTPVARTDVTLRYYFAR